MKRIFLLIAFFVGLIPNLQKMSLESAYYAVGQSMYNEGDICDTDEYVCDYCGGCHTIGSIICNYLYCYDCKTYYPSGEECDCRKDIYFCVTCENYLYSTGEFFSHRSRYPLHKIVSQFLYCNDCSAIEYLSEEWIKHENHNYVIKNLGE